MILQDRLNNLLQDIKDIPRELYLKYLPFIRSYIGWLGVAAIIGLIGINYLIARPQQAKSLTQSSGISVATVAASPKAVVNNQIKVDVSGAVGQPGVKILNQGDRVEDAIKAADGLTNMADTDYVAMGINLAAKVQDGDKIFIPLKGQLAANTQVSQSVGTPDVSHPATANTTATIHALISINRATATQLNSLPGIGDTYSQRIIANRPYSSVDDLCSRKIFRSKSTCDKIRPLITL